VSEFLTIAGAVLVGQLAADIALAVWANHRNKQIMALQADALARYESNLSKSDGSNTH
jgi:hypothetical protein